MEFRITSSSIKSRQCETRNAEGKLGGKAEGLSPRLSRSEATTFPALLDFIPPPLIAFVLDSPI
jgi:hypothetical protein